MLAVELLQRTKVTAGIGHMRRPCQRPRADLARRPERNYAVERHCRRAIGIFDNGYAACGNVIAGSREGAGGVGHCAECRQGG